jgi:ABC-type phosphate transport system permease subunit
MAAFNLSIIFGVFGMTFFVYGKKQQKDIPFYAGIALMVIPPFINNLYILVLVGVILTILPFVIRE